MTKKLEDILNLPNVKEAFKEVDKKEKDKKIKDAGQENPSTKNLDPKTQANLQKSYAEFDKIAASLPQVKGLGEMSDLEMDKLAIEAEESYKNLDGPGHERGLTLFRTYIRGSEQLPKERHRREE